MTTSPHSPAIRHCDVAIIGGSAAGLAAAVQLGRQRRSVIVIDASTPRNARAAHLHGYLSRDGVPPAALLAAGRDEVHRYGGEILRGTVTTITRASGDDGSPFRVAIGGDVEIVARRAIAATGVVDELPDIPGLAEQWGRGVVHCPFCHGYEVRDLRIVYLLVNPAALHSLPLFRQLTGRLTVVVHEPGSLDETARDKLAALERGGVTVEEGPVARVLSGDDGSITGVLLADGRRLDADAVATGSTVRARIEPFVTLGLRAEDYPAGFGSFVAVDSMGRTSVPGLYAAGNLTDQSQQVIAAGAHGGTVGAMVSLSLAEEDLRAAQRPSGNETDWDQRYSGDVLWSGNPNGSLVAEVAGMPAGRALDVGAGEGGDAIWLAEQGWEVTANDVSERALDRVRGAAALRGVSVSCVRADANGLGVFETAAFDLVCAQYASIPRTADGRAVASLMAAVKPGGTLLVVGHRMNAQAEHEEDGHSTHGPREHRHGDHDPAAHTRAFDHEAYVGVDAFAAAVAASADWEVVVHEVRPRPPGAASGQHAEDVVMRARRCFTPTG